jgi:hypothetical protein
VQAVGDAPGWPALAARHCCRKTRNAGVELGSTPAWLALSASHAPPAKLEPFASRRRSCSITARPGSSRCERTRRVPRRVRIPVRARRFPLMVIQPLTSFARLRVVMHSPVRTPGIRAMARFAADTVVRASDTVRRHRGREHPQGAGTSGRPPRAWRRRRPIPATPRRRREVAPLALMQASATICVGSKGWNARTYGQHRADLIRLALARRGRGPPDRRGSASGRQSRPVDLSADPSVAYRCTVLALVDMMLESPMPRSRPMPAGTLG